MANDIVAGLFGLSPYQVQQQQQAAIQQQAQAYAQQDPFQRAAAGMYQGGAGLGMLGAQAAGMVNPEVEAAKQREAIMGGVTDMQTPQGLRALAAKFQAAGMTQQAYISAAKANEVEAVQQKAVLEEQKVALGERKQEFAETELLELKKTEAMDRYRLREREIEARAEAAKLRSEDIRLSNQMRADAAKERNDLMRMLAQQKDKVKSGKEEAAARLKAMNFSNRADTIIGKVDEALEDVGFFSTGVTGATLGVIPGTKAYRLRKTADTIKANIGFQELQNMRDASATGGALGQVAVKELDMLQATIANLDANQDPDTLSKNLNQVKDQYTRAKSAYNNAIKESEGSVVSQPDVGGIKFKGWK